MVKVRLQSEDSETEGTSTDISSTGMFVEVNIPYEVNSPLRLVFNLVDLEKSLIQVDGRAARIVSREQAGHLGVLPGIGIEFQNFQSGRIALIQDLSRRMGKMAEGNMSKSHSERRRGVSVPVLWGPKPPPDRKGSVVSVSSTGAFIATSEPETIGKRLYLLFDVARSHGAESVKAVGRVVRVNPAGPAHSPEEPIGMGIDFELGSVDDNLLYYLEQQLQRVAPDSLMDLPRRMPEPTAPGRMPESSAAASPSRADVPSAPPAPTLQPAMSFSMPLELPADDDPMMLAMESTDFEKNHPLAQSQAPGAKEQALMKALKASRTKLPDISSDGIEKLPGAGSLDWSATVDKYGKPIVIILALYGFFQMVKVLF